MSKETDDLHNAVLFESDRTCCVCRLPKPVQIHHIDGNHDNNERENLAVLCGECHDLSHTDLFMARNLNAGQVRLYDESWRRICKMKLAPVGSSDEPSEYQQEVLLEISLVCHRWKNAYMSLYPGHFREPAGEFRDIWDRMIDTGEHEDTKAEWTQYRPLYGDEIDATVGKFNSILSSHGNVVSDELKTAILRTVRQLEVERVVYLGLGERSGIKSRIVGVLSVLRELARDADARTSKHPIKE